MDRPEDVEPSPVTGRIYVACTNNSRPRATRRGQSQPARPRGLNRARHGNRDGHVVEIIRGGRPDLHPLHVEPPARRGDPAVEGTYFSGYPKERVSPISCPDNLAFDSEGNLWISTDGQPSSTPSAGATACSRSRSQAAERGHVQQFLSVPAGAETCGPLDPRPRRHRSSSTCSTRARTAPTPRRSPSSRTTSPRAPPVGGRRVPRPAPDGGPGHQEALVRRCGPRRCRRTGPARTAPRRRAGRRARRPRRRPTAGPGRA